MILFPIKKTNKTVISLFVILSFYFFVFRTVSPFFKYAFIIVYPLALLSCFTNRNENKELFYLVKALYLPIIIFLIIVISMLKSSKFYTEILFELLNTCIVISILIILFFCFNNRTNFNLLKSNIIKLFSFLALVLALFELFNFYLMLNNKVLFSSFYSEDESRDYNFALIPIIFGVISSFYLDIKKYNGNLYNFLLFFFFSFAVFISGSRRSTFIYILMFIAVLCIFIINLRKNKLHTNRRQINISIIYLASTTIFVLFIYLFYFQTENQLKIKVLNNIGIELNQNSKRILTYPLHRTMQILNLNKFYPDIKNCIWNPRESPLDPNSGWGSRKFTSVYPIFGINAEIVPEKSIGYMMDSSSNASHWNNSSYSYTRIDSINVNVGDSIYFYAYCFVSNDFNGDFALIKTEGCQHNYSYYDLTKKGSWQKLEVNFKVKRLEKLNAYLYWAKFNTSNFTGLKGYVIYAYPEIKVIKERFNKLSILMEPKNYMDFSYQDTISSYSSIVSMLNISLIKEFLSLKGKFESDTTYHKYYSNIVINKNHNGFIGSRTDRWQFALQIFLKEYNWRKKIFGGGFDYLNWYGYYFYNDKTKSDWPHNPFLSVLLYSGIVGLFLYIFLMYKVFFYYIKYRKEYGIFFFFFLTTFFFSFFSGNSPFDPPVMGFFVLLPFLIHYIEKKHHVKEIELD